MNTEAIEGEFREHGSTALAVREEIPEQSPALFGTSDPVEVIQKAVRVADALKAVVVSKKLVSNISGKEYPQVEAWLTLAAMLRITTVCEWTRRVENGWEARVYVRDSQGNTIGAAESQCLGNERSKKGWEDYALRSMAATRATSKALRSVLAFVMVLAGFEATPAEEVPTDKPDPKPAVSKPRGKTLAEAQREAYLAWLSSRGLPDSPASETDFRVWARGKTPSQVLEALAAEAPRAEPAPVEHADPPDDDPDELEREWQRRHKRLLALHRELGHDDKARHDFYLSQTRKLSSNELTLAETNALIGILETRKAAREMGAPA